MADLSLLPLFPILPSPLSDLDISPLFASVVERTKDRAKANGIGGGGGTWETRIENQSKPQLSSERAQTEVGRGETKEVTTAPSPHSTLHSVRFWTQRSLPNFGIVKVTFPSPPVVPLRE